MTISGSILLVGCGKMGSALMAGWIERGTAVDSIFVVDPAAPAVPDGVRVGARLPNVPEDFRPAVIVLAVKPQLMDDVVAPYRQLVSPNAVFLLSLIHI